MRLLCIDVVLLIAAVLAAVIAFVTAGYLRALAVVAAVVWFLSVNYDRL